MPQRACLNRGISKMTSRYQQRPTKVSRSNEDDKILKKRGLRKINHYSSPAFSKMPDSLYDQVNLEFHVWKIGSRFYKLAAEHYGDPRLWWIIAYFNKRPTDGHAKIGDVIYIPVNWEEVYDTIVEHAGEYQD